MPDTMSQVPADHPLMQAWTAYCGTDAYRNTAMWAAKGGPHTAGSLWAAFEAGFRAIESRDAMALDAVFRAYAAEEISLGRARECVKLWACGVAFLLPAPDPS